MCGIVGGVAERNVAPILLEGLRRLEYRGYDSSGMAVLQKRSREHDYQGIGLKRVRAMGKIASLAEAISAQDDHLRGNVGIAHTRWATHGQPSENNAHPHICNDKVAVVHNGIIENYQSLKQSQIEHGYRFTSQTDTEVATHCIYHHLYVKNSAQTLTPEVLLQAVKYAIKKFEGAYALGVMSVDIPDTLIAARKGSPLVIGLGFGEHFIASDISALLPVTQRFIYLEEGDIALIQPHSIKIYDVNGVLVEREESLSMQLATACDLGGHRHYMHKEIFEQPQAVSNTLKERVLESEIKSSLFGKADASIFEQISQVQIIACGTSYHAGMTAKYWCEDLLDIPCQVEVASEFRYRNPAILNNTLVVAISQSGETADTLAALKEIKAQRSAERFLPILTICNVPESSMVRESDLTFLTKAGPEIGVASTKAFTTQLVALSLLVTAIGKVKQRIDAKREAMIVQGLQQLPSLIKAVLENEADIKLVAQSFADKSHAIFLGRGTMYPIAMEGALKLKEISYIHAEAYPAGELKHGPLALIDESMPVVAIAPHDELLDKLQSNLQEVSARGGQMLVFEDERSNLHSAENFKVIKATSNVGRMSAPITLNIALQLLAYHVALIKGTDVDQPRNLAKSVTVE